MRQLFRWPFVADNSYKMEFLLSIVLCPKIRFASRRPNRVHALTSKLGRDFLTPSHSLWLQFFTQYYRQYSDCVANLVIKQVIRTSILEMNATLGAYVCVSSYWWICVLIFYCIRHRCNRNQLSEQQIKTKRRSWTKLNKNLKRNGTNRTKIEQN